MRKDVQEALENAIAGFEKRHQAEQERLRERERFETDWAQIRTTVVLPALEEIAVVLRKAGWQCEVHAADKDPGVHFTIYRQGGGEKLFITYQLGSRLIKSTIQELLQGRQRRGNFGRVCRSE